MSGFRDAWVRAAALLSLLVPLYFLFAAFATKYGLLDWRVGFVLLTLRVGPIAVGAALAAGIAGLALSALVRPRRGWRLSLFATLTPAIALLILGGAIAQSVKAPPIHDVSTDLVDPPRFSATIEAERALVAGSNSLDLKRERAPTEARFGVAAGRLSTQLQQAGYPDIQPIAVGVPRARALAASRGAAQALGWEIDRVDEAAGLIEARVVTFWYGWTSDIVIRVTAVGPGAVIDVRSSSRVGAIDLGANAERVRAFSRQVAKELAKG
jgi:fatty-acyl-CoA synthase